MNDGFRLRWLCNPDLSFSSKRPQSVVTGGVFFYNPKPITERS